MNYDQARQRANKDGTPSGLWDWTTMNDGVIHPTASCSLSCHHETQEEAERHFYEYCIENVKEFTNSDEQHKCAVCGDWTQKGLRNTSMFLIGFNLYLCDIHRNESELRKFSPFEFGLSIIHS